MWYGRGRGFRIWPLVFYLSVSASVSVSIIVFVFVLSVFFFFSLFFLVLFLLLFVVFLPGIHIDVFKFKSTSAAIKDQRIKKNNNAVIMGGCFA